MGGPMRGGPSYVRGSVFEDYPNHSHPHPSMVMAEERYNGPVGQQMQHQQPRGSQRGYGAVSQAVLEDDLARQQHHMLSMQQLQAQQQHPGYPSQMGAASSLPAAFGDPRDLSSMNPDVVNAALKAFWSVARGGGGGPAGGGGGPMPEEGEFGPGGGGGRTWSR